MLEKVEMALVFEETEIPAGKCTRVEAQVPPEVALFKGQQLVAKESIQRATSLPFFFIGQHSQWPPPLSIEDGVMTCALGFGGSYTTVNRVPRPDLSSKVDHEQVVIYVYNATDRPVKWSGELRGLAVLR